MYDIVMDLLKNHLQKGHEIYMDRFYSPVKLFQDLRSHHTVAVETCMSNRKNLPKSHLKQVLKKGEVMSCRKGSLLALKWKDKKDVLMLSTKHNSDMKTVTVRSAEAPSGRKTKEKPYNDKMGGVDKSSQMLSYYGFKKKNIKRYKKLFFHLVDLTAVNTQILFNKIQHGERKGL